MRYRAFLSESKKGMADIFPFEVPTSSSGDNKLLKIELSLAITTILLVFLFLVGSMRRFVRLGWFLWYSTKFIHMGAPPALVYIMSMMHSASKIHVLYPVWACALFYAYSGTMTTTAFSIANHANILRYAWGAVPLIAWTLYLCYMVCVALPDQPSFWLVFVAVFGGFLFVAASSTFQTLKAIYLASKSHGLPGYVRPLVQYMRLGIEAPPDCTPITEYTKYRYVVWGNPVLGDETGIGITTTEDLWKSLLEPGGKEERFPLKENWMSAFLSKREKKEECFPFGEKEKEERLWHMCISYAYFRLILRRFVGCQLHESSEEWTRKFVYCSLMLKHFNYMPEVVSEMVFRVVEEELSFLYNFFYTKSFVYDSYKFRDILGPLLNAALLATSGTVGISYLMSMTTISDLDNNKLHGHGLEVGVTRLVTLVFSALEVCKFAMVYFSNRKVVWLLCASRAVRESWIAEKVNFCGFKEDLCRRYAFLSRPWQRKLGQYSFLESYDQVPVFAWRVFSPLGKLVKLPRVGQKGEYSVALSTQVKQAIVKSLIPHVKRPVKFPLLKWKPKIIFLDSSDIVDFACEMDTDADMILVWHIATCFCESFCPPEDTEEHKHFLVATQLSKYCAYLVSLAPELLSQTGSPYSTESAFDVAVNQARLRLKGLDVLQEYPNLIKEDMYVENDYNIIVIGATLASALMKPVMNHPELGWKVMAEFWAEMLLYLAPSQNLDAHADYLARGGEFITHVWALLTNAGFIDRSTK